MILKEYTIISPNLSSNMAVNDCQGRSSIECKEKVALLLARCYNCMPSNSIGWFNSKPTS